MRVVGGQSVQANRLYSHFREDHTLAVSFQPTTFDLKICGLDFNRFPYVRTAFNSVRYSASLLRRIPRHNLIHVFSAGYSAFTLIAAPAILLARLLRKKVILHYHDGRALDHLRRSPAARALCGLAAEIITPTTFLVEIFAQFGLRARAIANLLDPGQYPFRFRQQPRPVFLHNRGMEPEYNVVCMLRAFRLIQERYPEAQLFVAHDGSLRSAVEATAQSLQLKHVSFTGAVSQARMAELYDAADVYISSADHDNMPGSVLEAFAAGLPVVATRAGGTRWIVRDEQNGLLVDCGDYRAIAERAFRLIEEPGLAARLSLAAKAGVGHYSWSDIGWQWLNLYANLAGRSEGNGAPVTALCEPEVLNK